MNNFQGVETGHGAGASEDGDAEDLNSGNGLGGRIDDVEQEDNDVCASGYGPRIDSGNERKRIDRSKGDKNNTTKRHKTDASTADGNASGFTERMFWLQLKNGKINLRRRLLKWTKACERGYWNILIRIMD